MQGRTSREAAGKLFAAGAFIAKVGDQEFVITADISVPITGSAGPNVFANLIMPGSEEYRMSRKATPDLQKLVDDVNWQS
jgi:hypothetical protein